MLTCVKDTPGTDSYSLIRRPPGAAYSCWNMSTPGFDEPAGPPASFAPDARFADRRSAGRELARALLGLASRPDLLVLGLPRGGVPVAFEVARVLGAELDVLVVRKLGVPRQPEWAMGAIGAGGVIELNPHIIEAAGVEQAALERVLQHERAELQRREAAFRGEREAPRLRGRTVIVVDDGIATGASMRAALAVLRHAGPARVVVATPVAPPEAAQALDLAARDFVALLQPRNFGGVGRFYQDFGQTQDDEVRELLARSRSAPHADPAGADSTRTHHRRMP